MDKAGVEAHFFSKPRLEHFMRALVTTISALILMAAQIQAMDWDTLSVGGDPIPPQATVSFSIGYPKGWRPFQDYSQEQHDIYNGIVVSPRQFGPICSFSHLATNNMLMEKGHTLYSIWPSEGATAAEAATTFFNEELSAPAFTPKNMTPIKTSAGDSGWLVESESYLVKDPAISKLILDPVFMRKTNAVEEITQLEEKVKPSQKTPVIYHDFFFHSGKLGAIRVEIMTEAADAPWRSQLDRLVLETLRFNGA
jgi:hypothetical protein